MEIRRVVLQERLVIPASEVLLFSLQIETGQAEAMEIGEHDSKSGEKRLTSPPSRAGGGRQVQAGPLPLCIHCRGSEHTLLTGDGRRPPPPLGTPRWGQRGRMAEASASLGRRSDGFPFAEGLGSQVVDTLPLARGANVGKPFTVGVCVGHSGSRGGGRLEGQVPGAQAGGPAPPPPPPPAELGSRVGGSSSGQQVTC